MNGAIFNMNFQLLIFGIFKKNGMKYTKYNTLGTFLGDMTGFLINKFFFNEKNVFEAFYIIGILLLLNIISYFIFLRKIKKDFNIPIELN